MKWVELVLLGAIASAPATALQSQSPVRAISERDVDGWRQVLPGLELAYPADHGSHPDTSIEWWYLTGNVEAPGGRRFGYQFTVFRRGLDAEAPAAGDSRLRARQAFAGHLALTDVTSGTTRFAERLRRGGAPFAVAHEDDLHVTLEDWALRREARDGAERLVLVARDPSEGFGVELELVPKKAPVLHGERGYSRKGEEPGNSSAYMSWTRLETRGRVFVDEEPLEVTGSTWFDHEFGSSVLEDGVQGWDWFSLQFDGGEELMAFHLRREDGTLSRFSSGTWVDADGTYRPLTLADFELAATNTWTSPHTGTEYPSAWSLRIASEGLDVTLGSLVPDAELRSKGSTGIVYWEGPIEASGTHVGRGYGELTGYAGSMSARF